MVKVSMDYFLIQQHNYIGIAMKDKNLSIKDMLKMIQHTFGDDIKYKVVLDDGRVFKSKDYDAENKYAKFQNEQAQSRKLN